MAMAPDSVWDTTRTNFNHIPVGKIKGEMPKFTP